jgi:hypothetical protein
MSVTTWANGYGVWHARVPHTDDAEKSARAAIRTEIVARDSVRKGYRVRLQYVPTGPGHAYDYVVNTVVYAERVA